LTPYSNPKFEEAAWIARRNKRDPRYVDYLVLVTTRGEAKAILSIDTKDQDGAVVGSYFQTWIKSSGNWYRAWYEDDQAKKETTSEERKKAEADEFIASVRKNLALARVWTTWEVDKSSLSKNYLYSPTTRVVVINNGPPISELRMMVRYIETEKTEVFAEAQETVVSSGDVPMATGEQRTIIFKAGKGFVVDVANLGPYDAESYRKLAMKYSEDLYFKARYSDPWAKYDLTR